MSSEHPTQPINSLLDDWPLSVTVVINSYSIVTAADTSAIRFNCVPQAKLLNKIEIVHNDQSIEELPINLTVRESGQDSLNRNEMQPIGFVKFHAEMNTDDGVVDDPAQAEGIIVISRESFRALRMLLLTEKGAPFLVLVAKGLEVDGPFGPRWDVQKFPRLDIMETEFQFRDLVPSVNSSNAQVTLQEIDQRLARIEERLASGVRMRLFR